MDSHSIAFFKKPSFSRIIYKCKSPNLSAMASLILFVTDFQLQQPIRIVMKLQQHKEIDNKNFIWVRLHINPKVGLKNPMSTLQFFHHLNLRKPVVLVFVKSGERFLHPTIECFFILTKPTMVAPFRISTLMMENLLLILKTSRMAMIPC